LSTGLTHELVGDGVRAVLGETGRGVVTAETGVESGATSDECASGLRVVGVGGRVLLISFGIWGWLTYTSRDTSSYTMFTGGRVGLSSATDGLA
jgi:hypothetical protein